MLFFIFFKRHPSSRSCALVYTIKHLPIRIAANEISIYIKLLPHKPTLPARPTSNASRYTLYNCPSLIPILRAASSAVSQVILVPTLLTNGSAKHFRSPAQSLRKKLPVERHCANFPPIQAFGCLVSSHGELAERFLKLWFKAIASGML